MSGASLYDLGEALSAAFAEIEAELEVTDGEFTDAMRDRLDAAEGAWQDKVLRTAFYADRRIPFEAKAVEEERRRLAKRKKSLVERRRWLKESYLPEALARQGLKEVSSPLATVRIAKGRARVVCDVKASSLPPEYQRTSTTTEPDKEALMAAHKANKRLPVGVRVETKPVAKVS